MKLPKHNVSMINSAVFIKRYTNKTDYRYNKKPVGVYCEEAVRVGAVMILKLSVCISVRPSKLLDIVLS